ncbi:unnamed protein product [Meloidogyne enterolobii]|uniref:Uncharacterized protein n=1 Tax=Meloidogyne enterolobii TaxID=390850 RepID=A0ACB0XZJ4_MELEN
MYCAHSWFRLHTVFFTYHLDVLSYSLLVGILSKLLIWHFVLFSTCWHFVQTFYLVFCNMAFRYLCPLFSIILFLNKFIYLFSLFLFFSLHPSHFMFVFTFLIKRTGGVFSLVQKAFLSVFVFY